MLGVVTFTFSLTHCIAKPIGYGGVQNSSGNFDGVWGVVFWLSKNGNFKEEGEGGLHEMCSSRKYPYLSHGRDFFLTPPHPSGNSS